MRRSMAYVAVAALTLIPTAALASQITKAAPMVTVMEDGWSVTPSFTVGETVGAYRPLGILDGIGAYGSRGAGVNRLIVNHEISRTSGAPYQLANGTALTGSRISWFDIQQETFKVVDAGPAFDTIYDLSGDLVSDPAQIGGGLDRFCSGRSIAAGEFGFVDDVYLTGEETGGGHLWALDVAEGELWGVGAAGAMAWENVTPVAWPNPSQVALLIGDDRVGVPLWLYVGEKNAIGDGSFLDRNGLAEGTLHFWTTETGTSALDFAGTGNSTGGAWKAVDPAVDVNNMAALTTHALDNGAFMFSRPEDVHENPADKGQVVLASTGRNAFLGGVDTWGTVYLIDVDSAEVEILYDGNDAGDGQFPAPQFGVRSPDNLTWASDGMIYVQEDRAVPSSLRPIWAEGGEAKIWQIDPGSGEVTLIAQVDPTAVPSGQTNTAPTDVGNWETSGILDVTHLFDVAPGGLVLVFDVQAHSLKGGVIDSAELVQGGQLGFLIQD